MLRVVKPGLPTTRVTGRGKPSDDGHVEAAENGRARRRRREDLAVGAPRRRRASFADEPASKALVYCRAICASCIQACGAFTNSREQHHS